MHIPVRRCVPITSWVAKGWAVPGPHAVFRTAPARARMSRISVSSFSSADGSGGASARLPSCSQPWRSVAEIAQGQSLAPLMLGREGWEPRPVILDEFDFTTGELEGVIEVVDGRWGASLQINPDPERPEPLRRPSPLLLYDLWNDPMALWSLHEERPDLVQKYTAFLEEQFEAHLALSQYFTPSSGVELTPEQLRTLRSLGYIN